MLDESLKARTREEHAALERTFLQIIRGINSKVQYAELLQKLYGYYHALEKLMHPYLINSDVLDYSSRRKSSRLIEDLDQLTGYQHEVLLCKDLPGVNSYFSALGAMYVLEGSTLGGKIIAGMLSARLNSDSGFGFFQSYGEATAEMWSRFRAYLKQPFTEEQQEQIIASALLTFITFKKWLDTR
jgi:heme oxygenase